MRETNQIKNVYYILFNNGEAWEDNQEWIYHDLFFFSNGEAYDYIMSHLDEMGIDLKKEKYEWQRDLFMCKDTVYEADPDYPDDEEWIDENYGHYEIKKLRYKGVEK